jgi:hypothetical protein
MKMIQKIVCGGVILAVAAASAPKAQAGDREWATAGKVLTGVAVVGALHNIFAPRQEVVYTSYPQPVVVQQPVVFQQVVTQSVQAQVVTQCGPTQTIVVPAQPTVVYQQVQPVVYQQAPVVVYAAPAPVIYTRSYYGGFHHRPFHR